MNNTINKILACMLVITLTCANLILLGTYANNSYAAGSELEQQETLIKDVVEFDAYFKEGNIDDNVNKIHSKSVDVNIQDLKIYVSLKVLAGYLKDSLINMQGASFVLEDVSNKYDEIEKIENNIITLNQIPKGEEIIFEIPVKIDKADVINVNNFSKANEIKITGTVVTGETGIIGNVKDKDIEGTILIGLDIFGEATPVLNKGITTYTEYTTEGESGVVLQTIIQTGLQNNNIPIKTTIIDFDVPTVNEVKPDVINVKANSLMATTAEEKGESFSEGNYKYYSDEEKIRITVINETNEKEEASWSKTGLDEYVITYVYKNQTIGELKEIALKANLHIETYGYNTVDEYKPQVATIVNEETKELKNVSGNIISFEIESTENISKGYMNHKSELETEYQINWIAKLGYTDIINDIEFNTEADVLQNDDGSIKVSNGTYYKSTIISKDNFTDILVNEQTTGSAYIEIWNATTGELISKIDETTEADEQNNLVVNYDDGIDNVFIIASHPVKSGELKILHNKAVKIAEDYKDNLQNLTNLQTKLSGFAVNNNIAIDSNIDLSKNILLENSKTKINATIDKTNLSTITTNNVKMQITLKNNNISEDLYKNPTIEVILPSYIKEMKINNIGLVNGEEFTETIPSTSLNEEGKSVLKLEIKGEQVNYNTNKTYEGAVIEIEAEITIDSLTPTIEDKIQVYVTNEKGVTYENDQNGKAYKEIPVKFESIPGMITLNEISEYNGAESVTSITAEEALGKVQINSSVKNAKVGVTLINNSGDTCENVSILGRLPFAGNKDFEGNELGSNITLKLVSGITAISGINAENVKVYYSIEEEATSQSNSWTEVIEDLANVKSYLIVLENYQMPHGTRVDFAYNVEIPANLKHNQTAYTIYTVQFGQESKTSAKVGLSTMPGPELSVNLKANVENGKTVQEGEIIKYTVEIKNTGNVDANNVKVSGIIPEGTVCVREIEGEFTTNNPDFIEELDILVYEEVIDSIKAGETKTVKYMLQVKGLQEGQEEFEISSNAVITVMDAQDIYTTNTLNYKVQKGYIDIKLSTEELEKRVKENEKIILNAYIININDIEKTNVVATYKIPEGLEYLEAKAFSTQNDDSKLIFNEETNTLTYNIGILKAGKSASIRIEVKVKPLAENETEKNMVNTIEVTCDQTTELLKSSEIKYIVQKPVIEVKQSSDIAPGDISVGDEITYYIEVKNTGKGDATDVKIVDYIADGLKYISTTYTIGDLTRTYSIGSDTTEVELDIASGETVYIQVKVKAEQLEEGQKTKEVTNIVKVSSDTIIEKEANKITHIINAKTSTPNPGEGDNDDNDEETSKYKIAGTVWQDNNENGKREDEEDLLNGIKVLLIDTKTSKKISETITDVRGKYEFPNLEPGRYMVAFMYNNQEYMVTTYQIEGINESRNSDAIDHRVTVEGEEIEAAVTNNINLTSSNAYNIDLGLVLRNRFDLSLSKKINKITVKTTKGTENYTYEEGEQLAKIDIAPKRIEGASVVIEYKIAVTNKGNISGFVSKVVDYLPKELKFSSKLNSDWYEAEDGNIYSSALAQTEIQPGETKEITLVLTKTMTGENTGMVHNTAEIYEAYNEFGIEDIDSTPANKVQKENDISYADVMLTVNTGEPAMYITLTIAMLALFAVGAYIINKKVLKK